MIVVLVCLRGQVVWSSGLLVCGLGFRVKVRLGVRVRVRFRVG